MRGNMDTLVIDSGIHSRLAGLLAQTRAPLILTTTIDTTPTLPKPYVRTKSGVIFGLHPVLDFLLTRVTQPALLDSDPVKRGMQLTILYAMLDREFDKVRLGSDEDVADWLTDLNPVLKFNQFYTGETLSICDLTLCCLLDYATQVRGVKTHATTLYLERCHTAIRTIQTTNELSLCDD